MKKLIFNLLLATILVGCTAGGGGGSAGGGAPTRGGGGGTGRWIPGPGGSATGGVDVGNMHTVQVPKTNATMMVLTGWNGATTGNLLAIKNSSGSVIGAKRAEVKDLASPSAISMQQYLKGKYPERDYKIVKVGGLDGVRADLADTDTERKSDIFLFSELNDFIHIEADLKKTDDGIKKGEEILATVRIEYKGVAVKDSKPNKITLLSYNLSGDERMKAAYTMSQDCYTYVDRNCNNGVGIIFMGKELSIGIAGLDSGHIVEMGPQSEVPFEQIKVDGKFLVAPAGKLPLEDIYTAFTPENRVKEQSRVEVKEGYVYLMRSMSWPDEDMIFKVRVERVDADKELTLTYEKLVYVEPKELKKQVDMLNKYTKEFEKPLTTGEVTLFGRTAYNNYSHASFNFEYSTSGNPYITNNSWDILFGNGHDKPKFDVAHSGSGIGAILDVGQRELSEITVKEFPDPNTFNPSSRGAEAVVGHTYIVYHFDYDGRAIYGALKVLALDDKGKWVRLQFRRIAIDKVGYFQNWIPLAVPKDLVKVQLETGGNQQRSRFLPFIMKREDEGSHYYETMDFREGSPAYLSVDPRPYEKGRGFAKLNPRTDIDKVTQTQVENLRGKFERDIEPKAGEVYAVLLDNYYDKMVMVMRVEKVTAKSIELSFRYLYRGKTVYSGDKE